MTPNDLRMPKGGDVYRHYKGALYTVISVGVDAETGKPKVYYCESGRHYSAPLMFDRPLEVWLQSIDYPLQTIGEVSRGPRFKFEEHRSPDTLCWYLPEIKS